MTRITGRLIAGAAMIGLVSLVSPALSASADPAAKPVVIGFGAWDYSTLSDVYSSILSDYGSTTTTAFFRQQAEIGGAASLIPELGQLSATDQSAALLGAAEAARTGSPLTSRYASIGESSVATAAVAAGAPDVPVMGSAINTKHSWQRQTTYYWEDCNPGCKVTASLQFRYTTDPGNTGSKTSLNFLRTGSRLGNLTLLSRVYSSGSLISSVTNNWEPSGAWTQWNSPHVATAGKTFQAYYKTQIGTPNGVAVDQYKTQVATCSVGSLPDCLWP